MMLLLRNSVYFSVFHICHTEKNTRTFLALCNYGLLVLPNCVPVIRCVFFLTPIVSVPHREFSKFEECISPLLEKCPAISQQLRNNWTPIVEQLKCACSNGSSEGE